MKAGIALSKLSSKPDCKIKNTIGISIVKFNHPLVFKRPLLGALFVFPAKKIFPFFSFPLKIRHIWIEPDEKSDRFILIERGVFAMVNAVIGVAKALDHVYAEKYGRKLEEPKMQLLMYLAQREALIQMGKPLFDEQFYARRHGPSLYCLRVEYRKSEPFANVLWEGNEKERKVLQSVVDRYGNIDVVTLAAMVRREFSWKAARRGLNAEEEGRCPISNAMIATDAAREKAARVLGFSRSWKKEERIQKG